MHKGDDMRWAQVDAMSVTFSILYLLTIALLVVVHTSSLESIRTTALGKHSLRVAAETAAALLQACQRPSPTSSVITPAAPYQHALDMLPRARISSDIDLMVIGTEGTVYGDSRSGETGGRNIAGFHSSFESLVAKARAGGGYVAHRQRDSEGVRRTVTTYVVRIRDTDLIACASRADSRPIA